MRLFRKLKLKLGYLDAAQVEQIHQAYLTALAAHQGQKRDTGEPYITHPVAVACILAEMKMDYQTIMVALLHDVIEDTPVTKADLTLKFGDTVAELVDGVSKLTQMESFSRAQAQAENFVKMILAMSRDIRVIIIKLADRLHNMRTLSPLPPEKRLRIAKETREIFAPIAKRLGMYDLSVELEELSFMTHNPRRYAVLRKAVEGARKERKKVLDLVGRTLLEGLQKAHLPPFSIVGREKPLYSIYRKMRRKHLPFHEVMDVYAFRIIVEDVDTCYHVLGAVHRIFKPVPKKIKDYIAIPKTNGYQSLHTVLFGPYGYPIEVQIRTTEMNYQATSGILAHWMEKFNSDKTNSAQMHAQQWVKNLLELERDTSSSLEFIENVKSDLFPDEIYAFTPKGKIMRFRAGATVIDFAYAVHTDIGNTCVAAKINRQLVSLSSPLVSGQTVEIMTNSQGQPNPAWLDFVVTRQARHHIRQFLKNKHNTEAVVLGKKLLNKALQQHRLTLKKIPDDVLQMFLKEAQLNNLEELWVEMGLGNRLPALVGKRLADMAQPSFVSNKKYLKAADEKPLVIKGTEGMAVIFSECCHPIPGDPIVGWLGSHAGLMVHSEQCSRLDKLHGRPGTYMALRWDDAIHQTFPAIIFVDAVDEPRLLARITAAIADAEADISDLQVKNQGGQHYQFTFKLSVCDRVHLARVLRQIRRISAVSRISRGSQFSTNGEKR